MARLARTDHCRVADWICAERLVDQAALGGIHRVI
jgi:hypothetical protein